ncbi:MAG: hypothetical protein AMXMBFR13_18370 [Phycisphaerae bacterium]
MRTLHGGWILATVLLAPRVTTGATEDLGDGFLHHGVATPVSNHRGIVATVDGEGRNVALVWLFDHRGGYALLLIDAETGKSEEFPMPFPPGGDCPYASVLSSGNKYYTHFNSHFVEFDPVRRAFTFHAETAPRMAMGMTEDDNGVIWSVSYPQSGVVSFDPKTRAFKDYGHVHTENWEQYQRTVAADDTGWIYFGIGNTKSHVMGLDPKNGKAKPMVPDSERVQGTGEVRRDLNGKVYGTAGGDWYEFYKGQARKIGARPDIKPKPIITSSQGLFHQDFPDGKRLTRCDTVERTMEVEDPKTGNKHMLKFDYHSEGAHIMGLAVAPDGTICGGTAFPMRFFSYNPKTDKWINRESYGQWNTVTRQGDRFFVGTYTQGGLLEWDPSRPWVPTEVEKAESNPRLLAQGHHDIYRPHGLLALDDGSRVIMAGTPGYGYTGGGLLIWDRKPGKHTLLTHKDLLPEHATVGLAALPGGKLLCGSTTSPGTGGEQKATLAELYILDLASKRLEWHEPVLPGVQSYRALCPGPRGLIYGVADNVRFFVFDPEQRKVIHEQNTAAEFGNTASGQGPRLFVRDPEGGTYLLFRGGIGEIDANTFKVTQMAKSPVPIACGGDFLDGRIYFASGSHVYSYRISAGVDSRPR